MESRLAANTRESKIRIPQISSLLEKREDTRISIPDFFKNHYRTAEGTGGHALKSRKMKLSGQR